MGGQCFQIPWIRREHNASGFRARNHQGVDGRTATREPSQKRRSPGQCLRNLVDDLTGLEKPVLVRVTPGMALQTFDQNDGRNFRRPVTFLAEGAHQNEHVARRLGETADTPRIED